MESPVNKNQGVPQTKPSPFQGTENIRGHPACWLQWSGLRVSLSAARREFVAPGWPLGQHD